MEKVNEGRYSKLIAELAEHGIQASLRQSDQLLLPARVWLTWNEGWYISTWLPAMYAIPKHINLVDLCRECLTANDEGGWYKIPERISESYRLERLEDKEVDRLLLEMSEEPEDEVE